MIISLTFFLVLIPFMPSENYWAVPFIYVIFGFLIFTFIRSVMLDTISLSTSGDRITISRLFGFKRIALKMTDMKGFSDSEIEIGRMGFKAKTVILYTQKNEAFELIKYNYKNFQEIRNFLTRFNYLGEEPYETGLYFRKYKFKVSDEVFDLIEKKHKK